MSHAIGIMRVRIEAGEVALRRLAADVAQECAAARLPHDAVFVAPSWPALVARLQRHAGDVALLAELAARGRGAPS